MAKDTQTEGDENILGGMQSDTKAEMDIMKKMFQGRIKTLTETLEKEKATYEKELESQRQKQAGLDADLIKAKQEKQRVMQNAKKKILQLKKELDDVKAKEREATPEIKEQPIIAKIVAGIFLYFFVKRLNLFRAEIYRRSNTSTARAQKATRSCRWPCCSYSR